MGTVAPATERRVWLERPAVRNLDAILRLPPWALRFSLPIVHGFDASSQSIDYIPIPGQIQALSLWLPIEEHLHENTRQTAPTGKMARKSIVDSDGPSTADVSANEDVEMQDQDTKMSGFKKFGVRLWLGGSFPRRAPRRDDDELPATHSQAEAS